jgi:rubrerythrin
MIDWPLALSTVSQAINLANELRSIDKELSQAELKLKIADLTTTLADLKMTLTEARADSSEKDDEISRLKKLQRRLADDTIELYGYRYRKRTDGKPPGAAGNPMCDVCLQKDGLLIETSYVHGTGIQQLQCPNCDAKYAKLHTYTD